MDPWGPLGYATGMLFHISSLRDEVTIDKRTMQGLALDKKVPWGGINEPKETRRFAITRCLPPF